MNASVKTSKLLKGATGDWEVVIGMEVHAQVTSKSKLFSGASTEFGGDPNSHVSLVDAAMPGMLPVINEECVKQAIRTGLGLKAKINCKSVFDRKNYFYPDLPQGYQISQYKSPIVGEGEVIVDLEGGEAVTVGIERLHLEQDAGKSLHERHPTLSYVDLNRSGVALMEIVSKPDLRSAEEAMAFLTKLRSILRYLGTCDGDMEKGSLRADVNVSVRRAGEGVRLGTRCEIKNMNSISFIGEAIEYEARRQIEILEEGGSIEQETRLYDSKRKETRPMRTKEEAHDYRYFPDPDLLPLEFDDAYVEELRKQLPELPDQKKARFIREHGLSNYDADVLVAEKEGAELFEFFVRQGVPAKTAANWTINVSLPAGAKAILPGIKLTRVAGPTGLVYSMRHFSGVPPWLPVTGPTGPNATVTIINMTLSGDLSNSMAKALQEKISERMVTDDPAVVRTIADQEGMKQVTDVGAIEKTVDEIIAKNPDKVTDAKTNPKAIQWFVGQVMKASGGKASPQAVNEILKKKLGL
jgi:aspartyl-tRNA(Asn)/glutamyl-tRNA(Gln) amidotransferase subunit B